MRFVVGGWFSNFLVFTLTYAYELYSVFDHCLFLMSTHLIFLTRFRRGVSVILLLDFSNHLAQRENVRGTCNSAVILNQGVETFCTKNIQCLQLTIFPECHFRSQIWPDWCGKKNSSLLLVPWCCPEFPKDNSVDVCCPELALAREVSSLSELDSCAGDWCSGDSPARISARRLRSRSDLRAKFCLSSKQRKFPHVLIQIAKKFLTAMLQGNSLLLHMSKKRPSKCQFLHGRTGWRGRPEDDICIEGSGPASHLRQLIPLTRRHVVNWVLSFLKSNQGCIWSAVVFARRN